VSNGVLVVVIIGNNFSYQQIIIIYNGILYVPDGSLNTPLHFSTSGKNLSSGFPSHCISMLMPAPKTTVTGVSRYLRFKSHSYLVVG